MQKSIHFFKILALLVIILTGYSCKTSINHLAKGNDTIEDFVYKRIDQIINSIDEPKITGDTIDFAAFAGLDPDMAGTHDFKEAFEKAIEKIDAAEGGVIYFKHSKGKEEWIKETDTYRFSGPIELTNNLTILMDPSTRILFEFNLDAYKNNGEGVITRYEGTTLYGLAPCIRAFNKENIIIKWEHGNGAMPIIQAEGEKWQKWMIHIDLNTVHSGNTPDYIKLREINNQNIPLKERKLVDFILRPDLVQFFLCKNILMDGLFLKESPFWVVHPIFSENLIFRNLYYDAQVVNNDGIDVESSRNVCIENVIFNNHDDNVVIKAGRDQEGMFGVDITGTELEHIESRYINNNKLGGKTENVAVRNCVFHGHHAVCIGSEMSGGANDIYVADCFSPQHVFMALYLKGSRKRGGEVHDVYMINCDFGHVKNDVVGLIPNYDGDTISPYPSYFHDVYVKNVNVDLVDGHGVRSLGWPDQLIKNVYIENLKIDSTRDGHIQVKQSKNIQLKNVEIEGEKYNETIDHQDENFKPGKQV